MKRHSDEVCNFDVALFELISSKCFREKGSYQLDRQSNYRDFICDGCNETKVVASLESVNSEQDSCTIKDIRYRCLVCRDFDLCSDCEGLGYHCGHMMIRITQPTHRNVKYKKMEINYFLKLFPLADWQSGFFARNDELFAGEYYFE